MTESRIERRCRAIQTTLPITSSFRSVAGISAPIFPVPPRLALWVQITVDSVEVGEWRRSQDVSWLIHETEKQQRGLHFYSVKFAGQNGYENCKRNVRETAAVSGSLQPKKSPFINMGCLVQVGNGIELEAVGPYRWRPCGVTWDSSRTVVVIKLWRTSALILTSHMHRHRLRATGIQPDCRQGADCGSRAALTGSQGLTG